MGALYLVSDVHGFRDDLEQGLEQVGFGADDELWILGDLVDRGPDGIGVVNLVRSLQEQHPGRVQVLMGNHEILALGRHRFPHSKFADSWLINGGKRRDQEGLTDEHIEWLASLPLMAQVGDFLLMHSDTTEYLAWGNSVDEVNETVAAALSDADDLDAHWDVWRRLTSRYDFADEDGAAVAEEMLATYGGEVIVHGHSIISTLIDVPSPEVKAPLLYADERVLDIDGGRYDGGPLLFVRVD
ncbi:MAG TPA: metallophosphoesterase family protein [Nocardioidaceae bacterium]|nr:metallophosphoesterase family protein [Nocardioidaceae bacterium]